MKKLLYLYLVVLISQLSELFSYDQYYYKLPAVYNHDFNANGQLNKSGYQELAIISINKRFSVPKIVTDIVEDLRKTGQVKGSELDNFNRMAIEIKSVVFVNNLSFQLATDRFISTLNDCLFQLSMLKDDNLIMQISEIREKVDGLTKS